MYKSSVTWCQHILNLGQDPEQVLYPSQPATLLCYHSTAVVNSLAIHVYYFDIFAVCIHAWVHHLEAYFPKPANILPTDPPPVSVSPDASAGQSLGKNTKWSLKTNTNLSDLDMDRIETIINFCTPSSFHLYSLLFSCFAFDTDTFSRECHLWERFRLMLQLCEKWQRTRAAK